jgi:hypothetical protein
MSWAPVKSLDASVATLVLPTALSTRSIMIREPIPMPLGWLPVIVIVEMSADCAILAYWKDIDKKSEAMLVPH